MHVSSRIFLSRCAPLRFLACLPPVTLFVEAHAAYSILPSSSFRFSICSSWTLAQLICWSPSSPRLHRCVPASIFVSDSHLAPVIFTNRVIHTSIFTTFAVLCACHPYSYYGLLSQLSAPPPLPQALHLPPDHYFYTLTPQLPVSSSQYLTIRIHDRLRTSLPLYSTKP